MIKNELRKKMKKIRDNIPSDKRKIEDQIIAKTLINSEIYINAETLFIYNSFRSEVCTTYIIKEALNEKIVALPVTNSLDHSMEAYEINEDSVFVQDSYGIQIPDTKTSNIINPKEIDLTIVPLIAYDNLGNRLGYGGGYYDRYLPRLRKDAIVVGLAYSNQFVEELTIEHFDKKLDYVITVRYEEDGAFGEIKKF